MPPKGLARKPSTPSGGAHGTIERGSRVEVRALPSRRHGAVVPCANEGYANGHGCDRRAAPPTGPGRQPTTKRGARPFVPGDARNVVLESSADVPPA